LAQQIGYRAHYYPAFLNVALYGETFGHHRKAGAEILLDYLQNQLSLQEQKAANYGELLEQTPKTEIGELELNFPSAWSCAHGVGRWSDNCSCEGDNPWRQPLREALNWLANKADEIFARQAETLLREDLQHSKLRYIQVLLGKQDYRIDDFLTEIVSSDKQVGGNLDLLSELFDSLLLRQYLLTSCAWFYGGMGHETGLTLAVASDLIRRLAKFDPKLEEAFRFQLIKINNRTDWRFRNADEMYIGYRTMQETGEVP
jgi:hypothetical protein